MTETARTHDPKGGEHPASDGAAVKELDTLLAAAGSKNGKAVSLEGNASLRVDDSGKAYLVSTGAVDVFVYLAHDGQQASARSHVTRVPAGNLLFGLDCPEDLDAVAVGLPSTTVRPIDTSALDTSTAAVSSQLAGLLDGWVQALASAAILEPGAIAPPSDTSVASGQKVTSAAGSALAGEPAADAGQTGSDVLWVRLLSGEMTICDRQDLPPLTPAPVYFPLAGDIWLRASSESQVDVADTAALLQSGSPAVQQGLAAFGALAAGALRARLLADESSEQRRLERREALDERVLTHSFREIAGLLNPRLEAPARAVDDPRKQPLLAACVSVASVTGIDVRDAIRQLLDESDASEPETGVTEDVVVRRVAELARVRVRRVTLDDGWWRKDGGPYLGFFAAPSGEKEASPTPDGASEATGPPVALLPASSTSYVIVDPADGSRTPVTAAMAAKLSPKAYMYFRPFPDRALTAWGLIRFGAFGTRRDFLAILSIGLLAGILALATPVASQFVFDTAIPNESIAGLLAVGAFLLGAVLATALLQVARSIAALRVEGRMGASMQAGLWDRLLDLPAPFFRQYSSGDLANRAMGVNAIQQLLSGPALTALLTAIFSIPTVFLLFYYQATLALAAIAVIVLAMVVTAVGAYFLMRLQRQIANLQGRISGLLLHILSGLSEFRLDGGENRAFGLWADQFSVQRRLTYRAGVIQNAISTFSGIVPLLGTLVIFTTLAANGMTGLSPGTFIAFTSAFGILLASGLQLNAALTSILQVVPLYERARPILRALPETDASKLAPGRLTGAIEVNDVTFRYEKDGHLILKGLSIRVRPGEFVAIVGPSGAGKSTLVRLLLGFDKPETGSVYYDGHDLAGLDVQEVRRQIGTVTQDGAVMTGLILQNIIGSAPLTLDDAWEAARMAGLDEDIHRMPMGMFTPVSEGGTTFSGGQRQRLLIARALAKKPRIVLFDEATSSLDNVTQAIVSRSIKQLRATRISIAHRLSTIVNADRIYVIDNGQVVQSGTYKELMAQQGLFADMAKRQLVTS